MAKPCRSVIDGDNVFVVVMEVVWHCSPGQISNALYLAGGRYRRSTAAHVRHRRRGDDGGGRLG